MNEEINQRQIISGQKKVQLPILVNIFSIILIIAGVFRLLSAIPAFFIGGFLGAIAGHSIRIGLGLAIFLAFLMLIIGILSIVVAIGLRRMRRWALNVFLILAFLSIIDLIQGFFAHSLDLTDTLSLLFNIVASVYMWNIKDRFSS